MSTTTRSSRRVAARRNAVVDSDDEISTMQDTTVDSEPRTRRTTRVGRQSIPPQAEPPPAAARTRGRPKKQSMPAPPPEPTEEPELDAVETSEHSLEAPVETKQEEDAENQRPAELEEAEGVEKDTPMTPTSTKKSRTSTARVSVTPAASEDIAPVTPKTAKSDAAPLQGTPLADITAAKVNTPGLNVSPSPTKTMRPMDNTSTTLRPMDIVLKQRTATIPVVETVTDKPRIVLTHLILTNFKSYAGRQEVGPFHASFSSVVGPNGSGKSNVIDSLLFVFGFRASKMRQGKISALIHNSAQHPDLDHCEVAVHFHEVIDKPQGGQEIVPDSQLIISRKAFKNNSSKYYIDGKTSDFTTVTTLLKDKGVDLDHKRFLILQGEVESIAQMKPKAGNEHEDGLLEYLEDIIGTSKYKTPIEESATEVETLNEICVEKSGRVQHVEKEKNSLEDKKNVALDFVRDENDLAMKQSALYQLYIHECTENVAVTEEAIAQIQAQLDEEMEKHQGGQGLIKELEDRFNQGNKEFTTQEKQTQALAKDMAKFEQERVKFDEKKKFLDDKKKKLEKAISNSESNSAAADESIAQCNQEIEDKTNEIGNVEEQVKREEEELATIRESLQGKTQKYSDQIATKQKSLEPWTEKISQKQSAIAVAESELGILQERANAGAVAIKELETKAASIEEGKTAKLEELKACEEEKTTLLEESGKMKSEIEILVAQEPKMKTKISNARQKADEARSSLAQSQTRGNVLTALTRMRDTGRINGFHGRLGNLGTIDQKYDIAVSTAVGALDNFVTETVEAGQQCIEYLRKNNLGRGNFICLDKLANRDMTPIQTPEDAPRLFDLVKAKEDKFRPAFYHAMQDTLVATDLAQANRIAYGAKRWRVVTLDGELIDKSGTMSGGGTTVKRGGMSSKLVADTTKEQVTKLEDDRDGWESKFQEFQDYWRECENRLKELSAEIPRIDTKMQKINLEIESANRNLSDVQRRMKEVVKEHQPSASDGNRIAALEKEIAKLNADVEKLQGETAGIEEEIKALQDKIMEAGGEKLRTQRALIEGLKEEIATSNEEISQAEVRRAKAEKSKVKLGKDQAKAGKDLDAALKDLEKLEDDINNQVEKADALRSRVEEAEEGLAAKKQELKQVKAELEEKTAELNESRAVEIEMKNKLEENQKALIENQRRGKYWHEKINKLVLQDLDELIGEPATQPSTQESELAEKPAETDEASGEQPSSEPQDEDVEMSEAQSQEGSDGSDESDLGSEQKQKASNSQPNEFPQYTPDEFADMDKEILKGEIAALEEKTQNVNVDLGVLSEYRRRVEEHASRSSDLQSAINQRDAAKKRCDDLRRLRLEGFMEGFSAISLRLKEMYQMITMGGNAELELVDSLDPFSEGILFSVMPPKKSWKNISNLSGGEKTLSSLALVFALHHYKPTPLYVMDEIDAALDFRNVSPFPPVSF